MGKIKFKPTGRTWGPDDGFDWSIYEDGYDGGNRLYPNRNVKTNGSDVVYCHEPYAQELYDLMENYLSGHKLSAKDNIPGNIYTITEISKASDHEVRIDSDNGMTSVVDLNKEIQFVHSLGYNSVKELVAALDLSPVRQALIDSKELVAKVIGKNRVSIWEGYKNKIEHEFAEELARKDKPQYAYTGKILEVNGGGYTVDIRGVRCFMPMSLGPAGCKNPDELVGKDLNVCIVNYSAPTNNFVVSYRKYLEMAIPKMINDELYVGKEVFVKVTGVSRNGLFCAIRNDAGDFVFASLLHRSRMSYDMEAFFDHGDFIVGDQFKAFIYELNWQDDGSCRIVIGDTKPTAPEALKVVEEK